jgi:gamma-glutamyltranspeptidase/glutathione hydrolase
LSLGSAGGAAIIPFTARTLLATLVWGLDAQRAVDLPHVANFNGPTVVETGGLPAGTLRALRERGHVVVEQDLNSGLHVLQRTSDGWFGAADPRREGEMRGR